MINVIMVINLLQLTYEHMKPTKFTRMFSRYERYYLKAVEVRKWRDISYI